VNSQRATPRVPADLSSSPEARALSGKALHAAKQILREEFEVVATIEQLESQKNTFLEFFQLPVESARELGHVHRIDYAAQGVKAAELGQLKAQHSVEGANNLDVQLYELGVQLSHTWGEGFTMSVE